MPPRKTLPSKLPFSLEAMPRNARLRIGLLGGSFNPPHAGHVHIAREAKKRLGLDRVLWLVSPQNPLKDSHQTAPLAERLSATADILGAEGGQHASIIETRMQTRYTLDTIRALKKRWPHARFVWIMGSDNLAGFHRWKGWRIMARLVNIAVVERPPIPLTSMHSRAALSMDRQFEPQPRALAKSSPPAWSVLAIRRHPASSTEIRKKLGKG